MKKFASAVVSTVLMMCACCTTLAAVHPGEGEVGRSAPPIDRRTFESSPGGRWIGAGICYGPHRDGQKPGEKEPTEDQILEDMTIMARHWGMVRMYSARGSAAIFCRLAREKKIPLKLMLGAWIEPEFREKDGVREELPAAAASNREEIGSLIRLANEYPDVVMAVGVGNETQVQWSSHRSSRDRLIAAIREVRAATKVPVTTCDDFSFWNTEESRAISAECDFIAAHLYAMWNKQQLPVALDWTREKLAEIERVHPGVPVVVTEIGWATARGTEGYQAIGIVGTPGEGEQELFFRALRDWAGERRLSYFYFEAFDETWKGGPSPDEVEKHWGVFNSDRSPKKVLRPAEK